MLPHGPVLDLLKILNLGQNDISRLLRNPRPKRTSQNTNPRIRNIKPPPIQNDKPSLKTILSLKQSRLFYCRRICFIVEFMFPQDQEYEFELRGLSV